MGRGCSEVASAVQYLPVDQIHELDCGQHAAKPTTKALKMIQLDYAKFRMGKVVGTRLTSSRSMGLDVRKISTKL